MGALRTHGIDRVISKDGDVLGAILDAGCASKLLAGLITEDGRKWTRDEALSNVAFFDGLTDDTEYEQYLAALESLLAGFFPRSGSSSTASPTSSRARRKTSAEKRAARRAMTPPSDSATGPTSAPPSPSTPAPG
jgi:hypothetical protein